MYGFLDSEIQPSVSPAGQISAFANPAALALIMTRTVMRPITSWPRSVLFTLAVLLASATSVYSALWLYYVHWQPAVLIEGDESYQYSPSGQFIVLAQVREGTAAEGAGLRVGDRIVEIEIGRASCRERV